MNTSWLTFFLKRTPLIGEISLRQATISGDFGWPKWIPYEYHIIPTSGQHKICKCHLTRIVQYRILVLQSDLPRKHYSNLLSPHQCLSVYPLDVLSWFTHLTMTWHQSVVMGGRRSHTKSRNGCSQCKLRRIKVYNPWTDIFHDSTYPLCFKASLLGIPL